MQTLALSSPVTKVVQPSGHVNAANAAAFQKHLLEALYADEHNALLVDMTDVDSLDSAGLMALVSAMTLAQQMGKGFGICSISPAIRIIFEVTQLDRAFRIFESQLDYRGAIAA